MKNAILFPLNILIAFGFCVLISLSSLSNFYESPSSYALMVMAIMLGIYAFFSILMLRNKRLYIDSSAGLEGAYKPFLITSVLGFVIEFSIYGIPFFLSGGRDNYAGIPVLHVVFYSCAVISVLLSSLYSNKKQLAVAILSVIAIGFLTLSRQMIMVSFCILIISSLSRYRVNKKVAFRVFLLVVVLFGSFGFVGDIRQKMSGDYVDNYIFLVGGANSAGEAIGSSLYWLWIYMATPVYNLIHNLNEYNLYGNSCSVSDVIGSCDGSYASVVLLPNTVAKYIGQPEFKVSLQIPYLNASTGYAAAARIMGVTGVIVEIFMQFAYYFIGILLTPKRMRTAFRVYFSALSVFMIFDNLFTHGEFFFGFALIITYNLVSRLKISPPGICKDRPY